MLGDKIKSLRKDSHITQSELAKVIGVSAGAVGLWELNRRKPDSEMLLKIAHFFKVTVDYLLCNESDNTLTIIGENGYYQKYKLTEDKIRAIKILAETFDKNDIV